MQWQEVIRSLCCALKLHVVTCANNSTPSLSDGALHIMLNCQSKAHSRSSLRSKEDMRLSPMQSTKCPSRLQLHAQSCTRHTYKGKASPANPGLIAATKYQQAGRGALAPVGPSIMSLHQSITPCWHCQKIHDQLGLMPRHMCSNHMHTLSCESIRCAFMQDCHSQSDWYPCDMVLGGTSKDRLHVYDPECPLLYI
jgi:hypothetical protein